CLLSPSLSSQPSDSLRHLHAFPPRRSSDLGFAMTILSAAIKAIPDDIVEAARLDGLKGFGMFRYITIPSVRPALVVVLTTIAMADRKSTRLNSSHVKISYAVFCLKKKIKNS